MKIFQIARMKKMTQKLIIRILSELRLKRPREIPRRATSSEFEITQEFN